MKLRLLFLVTLLLITVAGVGAQSIPPASINISATVNASEIEIVTVQPMNLADAEPVEGIVTVDPVLNPRAGKMMAFGNRNSEFRIGFDRIRELSNVTGQGFIFVEYDVAGNLIDEQETSELYEEENRSLQFSEEGTYYFWIGGRIDLSQAAPGTYEGEFTIEIEYL